MNSHFIDFNATYLLTFKHVLKNFLESGKEIEEYNKDKKDLLGYIVHPLNNLRANVAYFLMLSSSPVLKCTKSRPSRSPPGRKNVDTL